VRQGKGHDAREFSVTVSVGIVSEMLETILYARVRQPARCQPWDDSFARTVGNLEPDWQVRAHAGEGRGGRGCEGSGGGRGLPDWLRSRTTGRRAGEPLVTSGAIGQGWQLARASERILIGWLRELLSEARWLATGRVRASEF
jgi:hypothetical protein